jgi:flagellar motor switch protein FliN
MVESANVNEAVPGEKTIEDIHHFQDVPVRVGIQLAQRTMKVQEILQLQPNSIVELPKSAGENVDILINERLIAFGEVLELEGSTGIRLTDFNTQI